MGHTAYELVKPDQGWRYNIGAGNDVDKKPDHGLCRCIIVYNAGT